jgi:hypothetical protein
VILKLQKAETNLIQFLLPADSSWRQDPSAQRELAELNHKLAHAVRSTGCAAAGACLPGSSHTPGAKGGVAAVLEELEGLVTPGAVLAATPGRV